MTFEKLSTLLEDRISLHAHKPYQTREYWNWEDKVDIITNKIKPYFDKIESADKAFDIRMIKDEEGTTQYIYFLANAMKHLDFYQRQLDEVTNTLIDTLTKEGLHSAFYGSKAYKFIQHKMRDLGELIKSIAVRINGIGKKH